jgi:hypothetical protein
VDLAIQGCRWAADLGARKLIVWSAYDGYDYHFQVNYTAAWQWTVAAFQLLADSCPPGKNYNLLWYINVNVSCRSFEQYSVFSKQLQA